MSSTAEVDLDYTHQPDNKDLDHIPGDYGLVPYLGKTLEFVHDLYGFLDESYKKYGEVFKVKLGGQVGVAVIGAENYKEIYLDKDRNYSTLMGYEHSLNHFYRGGLLMRDFDDHRFQRRMFQTAFKNEPMRGYVDIMNPLMEDHLEKWGEESNFHFFPAIKRTLLDVGATVFIGVKELGPEMDRMNEAFLDISEKGLMSLFKWDIPGLKYHAGLRGKHYLENYFAKIIPERRAGDGNDMLSFMTKETLEDGSHFPDSDIIPHASFLLFAAHDTTTSVLTHMMYYTARHPEWQERLREESKALGRPFLTYDDLDNMEGLEIVFKESLRLNPSVSLMMRRTIRECELGGHRIPANTLLFIPPGYTHTMEKWWTEPMKFDPERFLPPREEHKNHSFCYVPFGGGAHKCIGMHFANMLAKCMMHQLLLNYRWSFVKEDYAPKLEAFPLPKPKDELPLNLERLQ